MTNFLCPWYALSTAASDNLINFIFSEIRTTGSRLLLAACESLGTSPYKGAGSSMAVLNTLPWERTEVVSLSGEGTQTRLGTSHR